MLFATIIIRASIAADTSFTDTPKLIIYLLPRNILNNSVSD
jgi:hypothetical protein